MRPGRACPGVTGHARHSCPSASRNSRTLKIGSRYSLGSDGRRRSSPDVLCWYSSAGLAADAAALRRSMWRRRVIVCSAAAAAESSESSRRRISLVASLEIPLASASHASRKRRLSSASSRRAPAQADPVIRNRQANSTSRYSQFRPPSSPNRAQFMFSLARRVGRLSRRMEHTRDRRHKVQRAYRLRGTSPDAIECRSPAPRAGGSARIGARRTHARSERLSTHLDV